MCHRQQRHGRRGGGSRRFAWGHADSPRCPCHPTRRSAAPGRRRPAPTSLISGIRSTTRSSHSRLHKLLRHLPRNCPWDPSNISRSNSRSSTLDTASHVMSATSEVTGRPTMPVDPRIMSQPGTPNSHDPSRQLALPLLPGSDMSRSSIIHYVLTLVL
jgi:hypothetical protein